MAKKASQPLKVVTLVQASQLQYRAYELTILDGKVISKRPLDRLAGDVAAIQASRCHEALWNNKEQPEDLVEDFKDI